MSSIKGENLRIFVGGKVVARAKSCTLHISAQVEDESDKDSTGMFTENAVTGISWDVQAEAVVTLTDTGGNTTVDLMGIMTGGTPVTLVFDQTQGTQNRTAKNAAIKKSGNAYLTDLSINAQNRQTSTYTCQFTGTGPLS